MPKQWKPMSRPSEAANTRNNPTITGSKKPDGENNPTLKNEAGWGELLSFIRRQRFIGRHPVFRLTRLSPPAPAAGDDQLHALEKSGQLAAPAGRTADWASKFTILGIVRVGQRHPPAFPAISFFAHKTFLPRPDAARLGVPQALFYRIDRIAGHCILPSPLEKFPAVAFSRSHHHTDRVQRFDVFTGNL